MLGAAGHGHPEALLFKSCSGGFSAGADLSFFVFSLTVFSCGNNLRQDPVPFEVGIGNSEWPGCEVVLRVISLDDSYVVRALRKPLSVRDA